MNQLPEIGDALLLGTFTKTIGYKGFLQLKIENDIPENLDEIEFLFLERNGLLIPYEILEFEFLNEKMLSILLADLKAEECNTLVGSKVYLAESDVIFEQEVTDEFQKLEAFKIIDSKFGELGKVQAIIPISNNPLLQTEYKGKEIFIPLQENLIKSIDYQECIINVECPDGLLEIYLD